MSGTKRAASDNQLLGNKRLGASNRTLVCAVRGLPGRVFTVTISSQASIHHLKKLIHQENAIRLADVDPTVFDVYSTNDLKQGWAHASEEGRMIGRSALPAGSFLLPMRRVDYYFPSDIPVFDSGVVHVVVDFVTQDAMELQVEEVGMVALVDDKPTSSDENFEDMMKRYERVEGALGLFVHWSISGTDFSQKHTYQGAKWLEYDYLCYGVAARVYVGDKTTWRELYVACNRVVQMHEGRNDSRYVENFSSTRGGSMLELWIGT
ncbi:hypothetical protein PHYPSEUDO_007186 [Phytophthora pseudosyringae]|uniref:Crinkler effector protein N-terminal domain-containing protein n=1 Tax=Phytophthora pseudosyringae TaxID=221518 RepID=A0A8T1VM57_9STRA|nr:hypothetical protein PHYPSEUDO_007186 [Phytophthora pseudosyringae]